MSPASTPPSTPSPTARRSPRPIIAPPAIGPGARANARRHAQVFGVGLVVAILAGTFLLSLPWVTVSRQPTPIVDALFTAVSAVSTTGLAAVATLEHWNWWGEAIVLALVQIGGLGFSVGASILLQMLRRGAGAFTLRDELLLKDGAPRFVHPGGGFARWRHRALHVRRRGGGDTAAGGVVRHGRAFAATGSTVDRAVLRGVRFLQRRLRSHWRLPLHGAGGHRSSG